jgi:hypothetical protein
MEEPVGREEFDALVYRVSGLQDLLERLAAAMGVEKGVPEE